MMGIGTWCPGGPRWRYTGRMPLNGEHEGDPIRPNIQGVANIFLSIAEALWLTSPSIVHAVDLISSACAAGRPLLAQASAAWLRAGRIRLPQPLNSTIDWLLKGAPSNERGWATPDAHQYGLDEAHEAIRTNRARLTDGPRNVAGWLDLSLAYAVLGLSRSARRAMTVAVGLAPNHRVVLRAAARLLVHLGDADIAHALIRRHVRTPADPWLMATEISLSQLLEVPSLFATKGRRFALENAHQPAYVTELAGAVAAVENSIGEHRRAHKLYQLSLREPTDNVVAQVQYLSQSDLSLKYGLNGLNLPSAVEARTWRAMRDERWEDALRESMEWQADEPFSGRPATAASYLALIVGNPSIAALSAEAGLRANEDDQLLRNNLTVAYARAGRLDDAKREFKRIRGPLQRGYPKYVFDATRGLMAYMMGDSALGRELYEAALRGAPAQDRPNVALSMVETEWEFAPSARESIRAQLKLVFDKIGNPAARAVARRLIDSPITMGDHTSNSAMSIRGQVSAQSLISSPETRLDRDVSNANAAIETRNNRKRR
jgi:tetratricopeptide (TPR) repeat protein